MDDRRSTSGENARSPRFVGQRVVVTGGVSGIGAAVSTHFSREGARVAIVDPNANALGDFSTAGIEVALIGDVSCPESVAGAFTDLDRYWGGVDILVNNAGISIRKPFIDITIDEWERVLAVNLTGVFITTQQATRRMRAGSGGVIVNIASVSGFVGMPNYASYNASKAGVIELTKTLALELAPDIRVNAVAPGYVRTPMQEAEYTPRQLKQLVSNVPLGRLAEPAEVASLCTYLASSDAQFITGQTFIIDGGESAGGLASS